MKRQEEYYVVEDLDTHLYWHIQLSEWFHNPFKASLEEATPEVFTRLSKKIYSERFHKMLKRHNVDTNHLGIAKVTFTCDDAVIPENIYEGLQ